MNDNRHCYHCGLAISPSQVVEGEIRGMVRRFCCAGCRTVCDAIHHAGLEGFYQRTNVNTTLAPPPPLASDLALYDLDEVQAEFTDTSSAVRDIHLLVEGIHCAACVWLIERALQRIDGVLVARVNLTGRRLILRWDSSRARLSNILRRLAEIGYAATPYDSATAESKVNSRQRALLFRMAFAGFIAMNLMWISIALYSGADRGEFRALFHWIGFVLATPTLLYSGYPFLHGAWTGVRRGHLTMDLPIAIGALVTYGYSLWVTVTENVAGNVYYDTVVNFLFVILVGRYVEAISKRRALDSTERLLELQPRGATVIRDVGEALVPIRTVRKNDIILVRPGERIAVDGFITDGHASVDEALLSGESSPVVKRIGDRVAAGTLNVDGTLRVRVEATLKNTVLGRIIHLVEDAQASKAPIQCTVDRIVPWFVSITLCLACVTFAWWLPSGFETALTAATAVLIITCPCAFGLATPMAMAVASGVGARAGVLVKNGAVLETLSGVNHIVFDKTGTLTEGAMRVRECLACAKETSEAMMALAASIERYSEHSVAKTIVEYAKQRGIVLNPDVSDFIYQPGFGVSALCGRNQILIGSQRWLRQHQVNIPSELIVRGHYWSTRGIGCVYVARDAQAIGLIAVADGVREDARALIDELRAMGMRITLLSGDQRAVAEHVAEQLGGMNVIAEVLPQEKYQVIRDLQSCGDSVVMVGDGINDAPALSRADVGIALGSGTDVSADCADIILIRNELYKLGDAFHLSSRTLRTIRQNMKISLAYNLIMVPLAMMGGITPLVAAIAMPISSLLVIANAARISAFAESKRRNAENSTALMPKLAVNRTANMEGV